MCHKKLNGMVVGHTNLYNLCKNLSHPWCQQTRAQINEDTCSLSLMKKLRLKQYLYKRGKLIIISAALDVNRMLNYDKKPDIFTIHNFHFNYSILYTINLALHMFHGQYILLSMIFTYKTLSSKSEMRISKL